MPDVGDDLRFGLRLLRKAPGFTAICIAALALGIGASAVVFSVVRAVLLDSLGIERPDRVYVLWETTRAEDSSKWSCPTRISSPGAIEPAVSRGSRRCPR